MFFCWRKMTGHPGFFQICYSALAMTPLISPGMNIGWSAVALPLLADKNSDDDAILKNDEWAIAWFASIVALAAPFGCLIGIFCLKLGRKFPMIVSGIVCTVGWIILVTSHGIEQMLLGRFIVGTGHGVSAAPPVVYIGEISQPMYRLSLINGPSVNLNVGIMLIYLIGFLVRSWRIQAAISAFVPLFSALLVLLLLPESPVWLLHKNREEKAHKSLLKLRGLTEETSDFKDEFKNMTDNARIVAPSVAVSGFLPSIKKIWRVMTLPEVWKPFGILLTLFFFQQFCGLYVLVAYSVDFVGRCGITGDAFLITVVIGIIQLVGGLALLSTGHRLGVRKILLLSTTLMLICFAILGLYIQFVRTRYGDEFQAVAIICLFVFMIAGSYGIMAVPWAMIGELYPTDYVHSLAPLTTCLATAMNFVTVYIYPLLVEYGFATVISIYCVVLILAIIFITFAVPETHGVARHDIITNFKKNTGREMINK